jgi:hypothetical protein
MNHPGLERIKLMRINGVPISSATIFIKTPPDGNKVFIPGNSGNHPLIYIEDKSASLRFDYRPLYNLDVVIHARYSAVLQKIMAAIAAHAKQVIVYAVKDYGTFASTDIYSHRMEKPGIWKAKLGPDTFEEFSAQEERAKAEFDAAIEALACIRPMRENYEKAAEAERLEYEHRMALLQTSFREQDEAVARWWRQQGEAA